MTKRKPGLKHRKRESSKTYGVCATKKRPLRANNNSSDVCARYRAELVRAAVPPLVILEVEKLFTVIVRG